MSSRKRRIAALATAFSLAALTLVYGFALPATALAWDDCPKGWVNDPYPGACRRYVDTNNDGICDLSQPKPTESTTTTLAVATTTAGEPPTGDCPLGPCVGCGACLSVGVSASAAAADDSSDASAASLAAVSGGGAGLTAAEAASATVAVAGPASDGFGFLTHYLVSPIAIGFFLIYGASFALYKTKRIRMATHRKIWNVLLLGTFLVTGIFGTILAFQLDWAPYYEWPINLLFWHVEAGIAMTFISLFHLGWHFKYYKGIVKNAREKFRVIRATQREFDAGDRQLVLEARETRREKREARKGPREAPAAQRDTQLAQLAQRGAPVSVRVEKVAPRQPFDLEREGC